jgi:periplasmic divalent cation tolerance protein
MDAILILATTDSEESAHRIAAALVEAREAACVSVLPGIRSIYRWQGKVCDEGELLLLIKTVAGEFEAVRTRIRQLHPYQVPEVIALPMMAGDPDYVRWLREQVDAPGEG